MSESIAIRRAFSEDAAALGALHIRCWQHNYAGILDTDLLQALKEEDFVLRRLNTIKMEHLVNLVAVNAEGQPTGFAIASALREAHLDFKGEVGALYVDVVNQGRGIGRALLEASKIELVKLGFDDMLIWVLKDNPACKFYARCGGQLVGSNYKKIGGKEYEQVAFGWKGLVSS